MPSYVISGCSGSGKSTLLSALAERGESVVSEPGRQIVRDQIRSGGDGLPWANLQRFVDLCTTRAIDDFNRHESSPRRTFFDRGFIDIATAVETHNLATPRLLEQALASKRYSSIVFMSPPWKDLFATDAERKHSYGDAVEEYEGLVPFYERFGYELVFLPQTSVPERVSFVLDTLMERKPTDES
jgi:predicted ATPase